MIEFFAKNVESLKTEYTDDFVVYGIFFEESDPEKGGQSWNFQRALGADGTLSTLGEDDEGVNIVKEIQQAVFYEEIDSFSLSRDKAICKFSNNILKQAGTNKLVINFDITDNKWSELSIMSSFVFLNCSYYQLVK